MVSRVHGWHAMVCFRAKCKMGNMCIIVVSIFEASNMGMFEFESLGQFWICLCNAFSVAKRREVCAQIVRFPSWSLRDMEYAESEVARFYSCILF